MVMTVYITNMHGQMRNSTAQIAQNMAAQFADEIGIKELGYYFYDASANLLANYQHGWTAFCHH